MKMKFISALLVLSMLFTSCATIFSPAKKYANVPINANIKGYEVYVNGNFEGKDLTFVKVDPNDLVTFKKEGYNTQTTSVKGGFNAVSLINLLDPTIIVGWIVDLSTGNTKKVKTKAINVNLTAENK